MCAGEEAQFDVARNRKVDVFHRLADVVDYFVLRREGCRCQCVARMQAWNVRAERTGMYTLSTIHLARNNRSSTCQSLKMNNRFMICTRCCSNVSTFRNQDGQHRRYAVNHTPHSQVSRLVACTRLVARGRVATHWEYAAAAPLSSGLWKLPPCTHDGLPCRLFPQSTAPAPAPRRGALFPSPLRHLTAQRRWYHSRLASPARNSSGSR